MTLPEHDKQAQEQQKRTPWQQAWRWIGVAVLALVWLGVAAEPARAHVRFFVGGVFGLPVYPYFASRTYAYPPCHSYPPYPSAAVTVPPRGWVRGHWAWESDAWGRSVRVWVPSHLR